MKASRPNILMIQSDQHRFDCVGANGHPLLQTPHMDRLAGEGMNFSHAFCPIPMCVPTRHSHLNGQWPHTHRTIVNWDGEGYQPLHEVPLTFNQVLSRQGFATAYFGRWHVDANLRGSEFGFDTFLEDWHYQVWRKEQGLPPREKAGFFGGTDTGITPEQGPLAWMAERITTQLEAFAAAPLRPFFLRWDMIEPHLPSIPPEPFASMYDPKEIPPWPGFSDTLEGKPFIQTQQQRTWQVNGFTWEQWAPTVARYFGDITHLDSMIGRVLDALDRLGLAENTIVIYTSDHGDMCGSHGMIDKHYIMYDDVVRIPFIVRWPGRIAAGSTCDAFVSNAIDLPRTFVELAGAEVPETFQGESLLPLLEQSGGNGREAIVSEYFGNQFGLFTQRMIRDRRWKYVWNATAEDELYDLDSDPGELSNRALDPEARPEVHRLRKLLVAWMEASADPILNRWTRPQLLDNLKPPH